MRDSYKVTIRPLVEVDSLTSYAWRNDPEIWKYTGNHPDKPITPLIERDWLVSVLQKKDQKRFAICVDKDKKYVGNVQLTDIKNSKAQFHIFIGEKSYWGKGIATEATKFILDYGFDVLNLNEIYLYVKKENLAAIKAYEKCGFVIKEIQDDGIYMKICKNGRK